MASEQRSKVLSIPAGCATSEKCRAVIRYLVGEGFSLIEQPSTRSSRDAGVRMLRSAVRQLSSGATP